MTRAETGDFLAYKTGGASGKFVISNTHQTESRGRSRRGQVQSLVAL
jgi:hypothetical protein